MTNKTVLRLSIFIVSLFLILASVVYLTIAFSIAKQTTIDTKKPSDVILVLGAKSTVGTMLNPCLVARVVHAVELYKAKYAPKLLFSGGYDREDDISEAETMKKIAMTLGVPAQDIILECNSTSTYENLLFSREVLQKRKLKSVIIVTEPFHMPRAKQVSERLGIRAYVSPAVASICWLDGKYMTPFFLREPLAIISYRLNHQL